MHLYFQDYLLGSGDTVRLIWAFHDEKPEAGADIAYHGTEKRGVRYAHDWC